MMELGEKMTVKALRERFLNDESSKIRMKPAIPEKPKTIPPLSPTAKISNPLIASINSAVENRLAPRVIFRDDKKTHPLSQPETSVVKAKPILLDKNQKKEADLIKQALKDKRILPMSPVMPDLEKKPKSESIQKSPGLETLVKVPTPFKTAVLNNTDKDEKDKTHLSEWDVPASSFLDHSDSSVSTQAKAEGFNKPVVPKTLVPPVRTNPTISSPVIISPAVSPSKPPALTVPEPVPQNGPQTVNLRPEILVRLNSNVTHPKADIFSDGLPEAAESPDIFDIYIPPPIIPEDFTDGGTSSYLEISPNVTPEHSFPWASFAVTPISHSPALLCTASPIQEIETPDSNSVFTFSPPPAHLSPSFYVNSMSENRVTESPKANGYPEKFREVPVPSSPMAVSLASALARAEEMVPVKHNICDKRLLNLLAKSKRKSAIEPQSSTPDILPIFETDQPRNVLLDSSPQETAQAEPVSHVDALNAPKTLVNLSDIPPVDYEGKTEKPATTEYNTLPHETALNIQDHRKSSPASKMVVVQKSLVPPPPPPRKPQLTVPNGGLTPEKLPHTPSEYRKPTILPSLPLEYKEPIIQAPADFTSEDTTFEDPSERVGSQIEAPGYENPGPSVHEKAFFDHFDLKHQTPNIDTTDTEFSRTVTPEYSDSAPNSVSSSALPSATGKQINSSGLEMEDLATSKKTKAQKNPRKGSPMNPYADTSVVTDEIPKKTLFSKNNLEPDDKELKLKEKQKQKDKEKEKEKDKKDQKDKKKEQKEKEREKKELKEKAKKENEIRKKFRITGEEEALYQAKVTETIKGRKDDLAIRAGEIVSIIRTTDCPKGKWLAKDSTNKYGYIPVESVEMNIQEMMVLGNKAKANNKPNINGIINPRTSSTDMISSHNYNMNQESFEDDSEDWGDDDDTVFPPVPTTDTVLNQRRASADIGESFGSKPAPGLPAHTNSGDNVHTGQEALHKLTTFFAQPTVPLLQNNTLIKEPAPLAVSAQEPVNSLKQEVDLQILPPPDLYADIVMV